mgnify:CR=1 FL=1
MLKQPRLIVSLTSFPDRMDGLHLTVESVINQTIPADLVVIWLASSQFPNGLDDVPATLKGLLSDKCQVRWCEDMRSYKKLIPSLNRYPNATIVTVDDDIIYERTLIEKLLRGHELHPDCIIVSRVTKFHSCNGVLFHDDGGCSYWEQPSYLNKLVGCGACLYPPKSLDSEVLDYGTAKRLAPTSDDIWFWLMGVKADTKIYRIKDGDWYPRHNPVNSGVNSLSSVNDGERGNFYKHFDNILDAFPGVREKLLAEGGNDPMCDLIKKVEFSAVVTTEVSGSATSLPFAHEDAVGFSSRIKDELNRLSCTARRWPGLKQLYVKYLDAKNAKTARIRYSKRLAAHSQLRCDEGQ